MDCASLQQGAQSNFVKKTLGSDDFNAQGGALSLTGGVDKEGSVTVSLSGLLPEIPVGWVAGGRLMVDNVTIKMKIVLSILHILSV